MNDLSHRLPAVEKPKTGFHRVLTREKCGLVLGPLIVLFLLFLGPPAALLESVGGSDGAQNAWLVLCLLVLMAVWWVTEAVPIPVTALIPLVYLPITGVQSMKLTSSEYMHPIIVLLMGGFIIAKAIERWDLHKRIALSVISFVGFRPSMLVAGFMISGAVLSMWVSNSATCIMLTPIALSVASAVLGTDKIQGPFTYALLLGIAYACSIGGLATPVGTPTNLIIMGYLNDAVGLEIGFGQWMAIGLPVVVVLVPLAWLILTRVIFKTNTYVFKSDDGMNIVKKQLQGLGKITVPEQRTLMVFAIVAIAWAFKDFLKGVSVEDMLLFPFLQNGVSNHFGVGALNQHPLGFLTDPITAIFGVILCFLVPSGSKEEKGSMVLDWKTAESIPWGPLLLFGGGMALAYAIRTSGLANWVGSELAGLASLPTLLLVVLITTFVIFITEVMSNVATASTLMPILGATALASGLDVELIALPIAMAASCAFMLPTATGPNAVVFASRQVTIPIMVKAGFVVNCAAIPVITLFSILLAPSIFG